MRSLLGALQFNVLPFGMLLLVIVIAVLWFYRSYARWSVVLAVVAVGAIGGGLIVSLLVWAQLLPWAMPCLGCLASNEWYSVVLTFIQGWGFVSAGALGSWLVSSRGKWR
jgi:hypothetical protein